MRKLEHLSEIYNSYDTFIIDLWGVIHNGILLNSKAIEARHMDYGGAPRPKQCAPASTVTPRPSLGARHPMGAWGHMAETPRRVPHAPAWNGGWRGAVRGNILYCNKRPQALTAVSNAGLAGPRPCLAARRTPVGRSEARSGDGAVARLIQTRRAPPTPWSSGVPVGRSDRERTPTSRVSQ